MLMTRSFCLSVLLFILSFGVLSGQESRETGLFVYDGGYFVKSGDSWSEYRPDQREGVWATYEQYNEEEKFYNLRNSQCYVSVPKSTVNLFYYAAPGEKWEPIYTTKAIYEYMPDSARGIYCYNGGYFVRDGLSWREYRPDDKRYLWAEYEQSATDEHFFYIGNEINNVAIPKDERDGYIYLSKDDEWNPIYSLVGIYDCGKGFDYSMEFDWSQAYDPDKSDYKDSVLIKSRISLCLDGRGELRQSESRTPFSFKSVDLYESTVEKSSEYYVIRFLLGLSDIFDSTDSDKGFVLYAKEDGEDEILAYVSSSNGTSCVVNIPGLSPGRLSGCNNTDVGDRVHDLIESSLSAEAESE